MKKLAVLFIAVIFIGFSACDNVEDAIADLVTVEVDQSVTFELPVQANTGEYVVTQDVDMSDIQDAISQGGFDASNCKINVSEATVKIVSPTDKTFADVASFEVYINVDAQEQRIAWKENIPTDAGNELTLNFDENLDLFSLLNNEQVQVVAEYELRNPLEDIYTLNFKPTYAISPK